MKKIEQKTTTLMKTVVSSCVLHNINFVLREVTCDDGCDSDDNSDDEDENQLVFETGNNVRDALKDFVQDNM